jgi:hypothetical protein
MDFSEHSFDESSRRFGCGCRKRGMTYCGQPERIFVQVTDPLDMGPFECKRAEKVAASSMGSDIESFRKRRFYA